MSVAFPVIDPVATGRNIVRLRTARGLTVRDLQAFFGFEEPQAIYKWQSGKSLPSVDNLFALGAILEVPLDEILVPAKPHLNFISSERQAESCRSALLSAIFRVRECPNLRFGNTNHTQEMPRQGRAKWQSDVNASAAAEVLAGSLRYDRSPRLHRPIFSLPMCAPLSARRLSALRHLRGRIVIPITSRVHLSRMLRFSAVHVSWRCQGVKVEKCDRRFWRLCDDRLLAA